MTEKERQAKLEEARNKCASFYNEVLVGRRNQENAYDRLARSLPTYFFQHNNAPDFQTVPDPHGLFTNPQNGYQIQTMLLYAMSKGVSAADLVRLSQGNFNPDLQENAPLMTKMNQIGEEYAQLMTQGTPEQISGMLADITTEVRKTQSGLFDGLKTLDDFKAHYDEISLFSHVDEALYDSLKLGSGEMTPEAQALVDQTDRQLRKTFKSATYKEGISSLRAMNRLADLQKENTVQDFTRLGLMTIEQMRFARECSHIELKGNFHSLSQAAGPKDQQSLWHDTDQLLDDHAYHSYQDVSSKVIDNALLAMSGVRENTDLLQSFRSQFDVDASGNKPYALEDVYKLSKETLTARFEAKGQDNLLFDGAELFTLLDRKEEFLSKSDQKLMEEILESGSYAKFDRLSDLGKRTAASLFAQDHKLLIRSTENEASLKDLGIDPKDDSYDSLWKFMKPALDKTLGTEVKEAQQKANLNENEAWKHLMESGPVRASLLGNHVTIPEKKEYLHEVRQKREVQEGLMQNIAKMDAIQKTGHFGKFSRMAGYYRTFKSTYMGEDGSHKLEEKLKTLAGRRAFAREIAEDLLQFDFKELYSGCDTAEGARKKYQNLSSKNAFQYVLGFASIDLLSADTGKERLLPENVHKALQDHMRQFQLGGNISAFVRWTANPLYPYLPESIFASKENRMSANDILMSAAQRMALGQMEFQTQKSVDDFYIQEGSQKMAMFGTEYMQLREEAGKVTLPKWKDLTAAADPDQQTAVMKDSVLHLMEQIEASVRASGQNSTYAKHMYDILRIAEENLTNTGRISDNTLDSMMESADEYLGYKKAKGYNSKAAGKIIAAESMRDFASMVKNGFGAEELRGSMQEAVNDQAVNAIMSKPLEKELDRFHTNFDDQKVKKVTYTDLKGHITRESQEAEHQAFRKQVEEDRKARKAAAVKQPEVPNKGGMKH